MTRHRYCQTCLRSTPRLPAGAHGRVCAVCCTPQQSPVDVLRGLTPRERGDVLAGGRVAINPCAVGDLGCGETPCVCRYELEDE